ncbi:MAG: pilus assembly protein PilP [Vicinamibacterales bacterium]
MSADRRLIVIALAMVASAHAASAQPAPAAPAGTASPAPPAVAAPSPPADYVYRVDSRRDPFVSLLNRGTDLRGAQPRRAEGVAGLQTSELAVRGIVLNRGAWAAIVAAPDGKVYTIRAGDRLLDGTVRTVTAQYVVVLQEVKDPLSLEKQREVRKYLRGGEEVK